MKDLFVTYEVAKLLKEKGFNEPCISFVNLSMYDLPIHKDRIKLDFSVLGKFEYYNDHEHVLAFPFYQQVKDWLSDKHQIFIDIETDCTTYPKFAYSVNKFVGNPKDLSEKEWGWQNPKPDNWFLYRTRKEALEEAIKFALTLI